MSTGIVDLTTLSRAERLVAARDRVVVRLKDGRTARLRWAAPRGDTARVMLPSGAHLTVRLSELTLEDSHAMR